MPRIRLNAKKYARNDFEAWIRAEMKRKKLTNEAMGLLLGFSGPNYSKKLSSMAFRYDELVTILDRLDCPAEKMLYFMTGHRDIVLDYTGTEGET